MSINETKLREVLCMLAYRSPCDKSKMADVIDAIFESDAPAEPTPDRTGTWWGCAHNSAMWLGPVTKSGGRVYEGTQASPHFSAPWAICESTIRSGFWLPIPTRPAVPAGKRLTGEVRVPRPGGETYFAPNGASVLTCLTGRPDMAVFGGRRWIVEDAPAEPLDDPGNAHCPPPPMPVAEQPAPAASEAVRIDLPYGDGCSGYLRRNNTTLAAVFADVGPADRLAILRAFDPAFVSVRRELVEAWKRATEILTNPHTLFVSGDFRDTVRECIAAIDAAKAKETAHCRLP